MKTSIVRGAADYGIDPDGLKEIEGAYAGNDWTDYTRDARGNVLTKRSRARPASTSTTSTTAPGG